MSQSTADLARQILANLSDPHSLGGLPCSVRYLSMRYGAPERAVRRALRALVMAGHPIVKTPRRQVRLETDPDKIEAEALSLRCFAGTIMARAERLEAAAQFRRARV